MLNDSYFRKRILYDCNIVALNGSDYFTLSLNVTIVKGSPNGTFYCVGIDILDDEAFEITETFTLELSTLDPSVRVGSNTRINIIDNDGKVCTKFHGSSHVLNFTTQVS